MGYMAQRKMAFRHFCRIAKEHIKGLLAEHPEDVPLDDDLKEKKSVLAAIEQAKPLYDSAGKKREQVISQDKLVFILELVMYKYSSIAQDIFFKETMLQKLFVLLSDKILSAPYCLKSKSPYYKRVNQALSPKAKKEAALRIAEGEYRLEVQVLLSIAGMYAEQR